MSLEAKAIVDALEAARMEDLKAQRRETTLICADMIESAKLPHENNVFTTEDEIRAQGYEAAQRDFAEMLRRVARGEIRLEDGKAVYRPNEKTPTHATQ